MMGIDLIIVNLFVLHSIRLENAFVGCLMHCLLTWSGVFLHVNDVGLLKVDSGQANFQAITEDPFTHRGHVNILWC